MMKGCWQMVFQQQKEAKQLLDGVVSAMMEVKKNEKNDDGVEGEN
jgi:hypothetical protein